MVYRGVMCLGNKVLTGYICILQFVIVSLSGWGLLFFGVYKFFTRGKGKKEEVPVLYLQM